MKVSVVLKHCQCPVGFQPNHAENDSYECICDSRLSPYITDPNCDHQTELVTREGTFWITSIEFNESNTSGYLIYPYCPLDYCLPPYPNVHINIPECY